MQKKILYCCLFLSIFKLAAQDNKPTDFLLTHNSKNIELGSISISDPYLSPISYTGALVKVSSDNKKILSLKHNKITSQFKWTSAVGMLYNPTYTSGLLYFGTNYQVGVYYNFWSNSSFQLLGGSVADIDFGSKYMPRNINNPYNLDLSTNLNLSAIAHYNIPIKKRIFKLAFSLQSPLVGYMFGPDYGTSYYEMFSLGNLDNCFHLSSIHNKRALKSDFIINIPFNKFNLHVGVGINLLKYSANSLVFKQNEYKILVGTSVNLYKFAGSKKTAPSNFISPIN